MVHLGTMMEAGRWLVYRFFSLPYQQRLGVARGLGLVETADMGAPDVERFRRVFRRAREKRLLGQLWSEVEALHPDGDPAGNPFAGTWQRSGPFARVAVRPAPAVAVSYGHGLSELFASWAEDSPAFAEVPVDPVSMPEGASESDRCLWRRMPALRPATAAGVSR